MGMPPAGVGAGTSRAVRWPGRAETTGFSCPGAAAESADRPSATVAARAAKRFRNLFIPLLLRQASYADAGVNVSPDRPFRDFFSGKPARIINQPARFRRAAINRLRWPGARPEKNRRPTGRERVERAAAPLPGIARARSGSADGTRIRPEGPPATAALPAGRPGPGPTAGPDPARPREAPPCTGAADGM